MSEREELTTTITRLEGERDRGFERLSRERDDAQDAAVRMSTLLAEAEAEVERLQGATSVSLLDRLSDAEAENARLREALQRISDLKPATPGPWQMNGCRGKFAEMNDAAQFHSVGPDADAVAAVFYDPKTHIGFMDAKFISTFDPPTVLSLLSRLSAAAERERELVEALRPFAVWAERMPEGSYEVTSDIANVLGNAIANGHLTGAHFRNAARVVQTKDPAP